MSINFEAWCEMTAIHQWSVLKVLLAKVEWLQAEVKRLSKDDHQDRDLQRKILHYMDANPGCTAGGLGAACLPNFSGDAGKAVSSGPISWLRKGGLITGYTGEYQLTDAGRVAMVADPAAFTRRTIPAERESDRPA